MSTVLDAARWGALVLCAVLGAGCAGVRVESDPGFELHTAETFAWSDVQVPSAAGAEAARSELELGVGQALVESGLVPAALDEADLIVDAWIDIDVVTANVDPNFDLYVAERFERAIYHLELLRPATGLVWRGSTRDHLRIIERAVGGAATVRWYRVDNEREWHAQDAVERLLGELPVVD